jgi:hypothetical protein
LVQFGVFNSIYRDKRKLSVSFLQFSYIASVE